MVDKKFEDISPNTDLPPVEMLAPGSDHHDLVKQELVDRINMSERAMGQFYSRWQANEKRIQAYIDLPDYDKQLKEMTTRGGPPEIVSIVVPYSYATIWTIVTYMVHTFA